jgi:hypothetical protein
MPPPLVAQGVEERVEGRRLGSERLEHVIHGPQRTDQDGGDEMSVAG